MAAIFDKLSAAELGRSFAGGKLDPVEATEFYLNEAKQTEAVFITVTEKRARLEAEAARRRWKAGFPLSSLDGVPIAWKDLFDVRQTVTTAGSAVFRNHPPATKDTAGRIARTVEDCVILDAVFRGVPQAPDQADFSLRGQRFVIEGAVLDDVRVEASIRQNLENLVDGLVRHGAVIDRRCVSAVQEALQLH